MKKKVPIVIADVNDETSLIDMCSKSKVVINCVGPYRFFGENVVRICIDNLTHYVDVSGEPEFIERMILNYGEVAKKKRCISSTCMWF